MIENFHIRVSQSKWMKIVYAAGVSVALFAAGPSMTGNVSAETAPGTQLQQSGTTSKLPSTFLGGVIEGFYGPLWSLEDSTNMFQFMNQHGMNTFVYAPKYDPYQRAQWRIRYPIGPWKQLNSIVQSAKTNRQNFVYSISPGLDVTYGSESDRKYFVQKIDQLRSAGVHTFLLSLDDIPGVLKHADETRYQGNLARAQSDFANAVWTTEHKADPHFRLIMAQTVYYGTKDCSYWQSLKRYLIPQVDLIWTGPWVLSESMTASQLRTVEGYMGHRVIIWDNYPANDFAYVVAKKPELFLGPLVKRDPNIIKWVDGYLFNPLYQARASKIPLWTCADYIRDPYHYQPYSSITRAVNSLGGPAASALKVLVDHASSRYYDHLQPTQLQTDINHFWASKTKSNLAETSLYADFTAMSKVNQTLHDSLPDKQLYAELAPWSTKLSEEGKAGMLAIELLQRSQTNQVTPSDKRSLKTLAGTIAQDKHAISGTVVQDFLARVMNSIHA